jgi:hypothetical protein
MMMNFFVLTAAQRTTAMGLDDDSNYEIDPRAIDNSSPGVGINLNDNATGVSAGATVSLTGKYVSPKRMVDDQNCLNYCPLLAPMLLTLPWCSLETETIFAPQDF